METYVVIYAMLAAGIAVGERNPSISELIMHSKVRRIEAKVNKTQFVSKSVALT